MIYSKIGIIISVALIIFLFVVFRFSWKPKFIFPVSKLSPGKYRIMRFLHRALIILIILLPLNLGFISSKSIVVDKPLPVQIILDVSLSMAAYDIAPSRFSAAKASLAELIRRLEGYDVSLITFSGIPFVAVPFSHDIPAILSLIDQMSLSDFPAVPEFIGTALGDALLLGVQNLQKISSVSQVPGVILLITDGDSNEGYDPIQTISLLKKQQIPVFVLGIGTSDYLIGYDTLAQAISTSINIPLLQQIATQTSGSFSRGLSVQDIDTFFQGLVQKIKADEHTRVLVAYQYLNQYLLVFLFVCLGLFAYLQISSLRFSIKQ